MNATHIILSAKITFTIKFIPYAQPLASKRRFMNYISA